MFESEGPTFREQEFEDYKANRAETPPDLLEQIPWVRRLLEAMRIPVLQYAGFEADDVIGAIARKAAESGMEVVIVSSDKDMLQLVDERDLDAQPDEGRRVVRPGQGEGVHGRRARRRWRTCWRSRATPCDNIPGAPGIGDKGARDLIARFGSVEAALERAAEVERRTYRESLQNNRDQILLSKRLATIDTTVPVDWSPEPVAGWTARQGGAPGDLQGTRVLQPAEGTGERGTAPPGLPHARVRRGRRGVAGRGAARLRLSPWPFARTKQGGLVPPSIGLAWRQGAGRSVPLSLLEELRPLLEDPAAPQDRARREVRAARGWPGRASRRGASPRT